MDHVAAFSRNVVWDLHEIKLCLYKVQRLSADFFSPVELYSEPFLVAFDSCCAFVLVLLVIIPTSVTLMTLP